MMSKLAPHLDENLLVVTSNCQTHGIALSLKMMLPNSASIPIWALSGLDYVVDEINSKVKRDFIWVTTLSTEQQDAVIRRLNCKPINVLQIPEIFFDAFHPDMTYVELKNRELLNSPLGRYHSKIAVWSHLNKFTPAQTLQFFNVRSYTLLGYLGRHENSMLGLKKAISDCGLEISLFNDVINHSDPFMLTFNHPKLSLLAAMAEAICFKLEFTPIMNQSEISGIARDGLFESGPIFPIYPGIADLYGLEGTYLSRGQDGRVLGLLDFLEESFRIYNQTPVDQFNQESLFTEFYNHQMLEVTGSL